MIAQMNVQLRDDYTGCKVNRLERARNYIKEHKGEKEMNEIETKIDEIVKNAHLEIDKLLTEHKKSEFKNIDDYFTISTNEDGIYILKLSEYSKHGKKRAILNNNVFETRIEAEKYANIDMKVREYIYCENLKNPIDWNNKDQLKYCLFYNNRIKVVEAGYDSSSCFHNVLYSTNKNMLDDLNNLIGKDDLEWCVRRPAISEFNFDLDNL
jgi:hypothetical protein